MLSNITIKKILHNILLGILVFLFLPFYSEAQVSTQGLYVESIPQYEVYSAFLDEGTPGICLSATLNTQTSTNVRIRTAPFSTIDNPDWTYGVNLITVVPPTEPFAVGFTNELQPATKYIVQLVELGLDGVLHIITPQNQNDDIRIMCTPNIDGTIDSSCQPSTEIISECSTSGINQALQLGGGDDIQGTASIENITPTEDSADIVVNTSNLESGLVLPIIYSSDIQAISQEFTGPSQMVLFTTNGGNVPVEILGLQNNTTYYFTILDINSSIIINTDSNLSYESFTTGVQESDDTNSGFAGTINVNINGDFGSTAIEQEVQDGFTQCGYGDTYDCDFNQLLATIDRIIKFMLYVIVLPLAAIMFAWSGIKLIIVKSQGKQAALSEAKSLFGQVLLGIVFAMGAWVIVKFILVILGYTDASGLLSQILGIST